MIPRYPRAFTFAAVLAFLLLTALFSLAATTVVATDLDVVQTPEMVRGASSATNAAAHPTNQVEIEVPRDKEMPAWLQFLATLYGAACIVSMLSLIRVVHRALRYDGLGAFNQVQPHAALDSTTGWIFVMYAVGIFSPAAMGVAGAIALLMVAATGEENRRFGLHKLSLPACSGIALWLFLAIVPLLNLLVLAQSEVFRLFQVGTPEQDPVRFIKEASWSVVLLVLTPKVVIVAPILEEFIFRGLLHPAIKNALGKIGITLGVNSPLLTAFFGALGATLFTSVIFAAIHFNLGSFLPLFALAVVLSLVYEYTGSIGTAIALHIVFNAFNSSLVLLQRFMRESAFI